MIVVYVVFECTGCCCQLFEIWKEPDAALNRADELDKNSGPGFKYTVRPVEVKVP